METVADFLIFVYSDSARGHPRAKLGNANHFAMIRKRKGRLIFWILFTVTCGVLAVFFCCILSTYENSTCA